MSRVADIQHELPSGIQFALDGSNVTLSNAKDKLHIPLIAGIEVKEEVQKAEDGSEKRLLLCVYNKEDADINMQAGTVMAHVRNALAGLTNGFEAIMKIKGTGYKVKIAGKKIEVNSGKSHFDFYDIPEGLDVTAPDANTLIVKGASKQAVGDFVDRVRKGRDARRDPYKLRGWAVEKPWKVEILRRKDPKSAK